MIYPLIHHMEWHATLTAQDTLKHCGGGQSKFQGPIFHLVCYEIIYK